MRDDSIFSGVELDAILDALPDPAFVLTRSGRYIAIFGGADVRYYHRSDVLIGQRIHDVLEKPKADWFVNEIAVALAAGCLHVVEYDLASSDVKGLDTKGPTDTLRFEGRIQPLQFPVQGEDAVLWVASNITARSELECKLRTLSEVDPLSGLLNRRKLMHVLAEHYETFVRYGTPTSVLIFDIDHFKRVNDEHGHLCGDKVISATADVCRRELRATDAPARLGGDEFVVLMPHTAWDHAEPIAERLRLRIAEALCALGEIGCQSTISGGLSEITAGDLSGEDVLKRADDALYQAKRQGRNRIIRS
ncbi:MAG TPA: GGDEF domain-containing protein [Pseudoduganella sp.]